MQQSKKKRLFRLLAGYAVFLLAGVFYALIITHFKIRIPCVFRLVTGLKCPGCGVTTMCLCLLKLDFAGAFRANPVVLCLLPLGIIMAVILSVRYVRTGRVRLTKFENIIAYCVCAVLVIFGILRNIRF